MTMTCWGLSGVPASEALASGDRRKLEMPLVQMTLMEGRPKEQLHAIMAAVTAVVAEGVGCDPKKIRVRGKFWNVIPHAPAVIRARPIAPQSWPLWS